MNSGMSVKSRNTGKGVPLQLITSQSRLFRSVILPPIRICSKSNVTERRFFTQETFEGTDIWETASTRS